MEYNESSRIGGEDGSCDVTLSWLELPQDLPFAALQLQMLIVFCVTQCLDRLLFKPLGFHTIVSQLMAGILLGKSVLGKMGGIRDVLFPPSSISVEGTVAMLSYTLSLFLMSVKIDFTIMSRTGHRAWMLGLLVLGGTLSASTGAMKFIFKPQYSKSDPSKLTDESENALRGLGFGATYLSVNSFPVIAAFLRELGLLNSELGRFALSAVLASEITCVCVMMYLNSIVPVIGNTKALMKALSHVGVLLLLLGMVIFVMRPCMRWMIRQTPKGRPVRAYIVNVSLFIMLLGALCTDAVGQFVFLGAYIVGGGILDGPPLGSTIVDKLDTFITGILEPYLIATCTMKMDLSNLLIHSQVTERVMILFATVVLSKIIMCLLLSLYIKMATRDALALAFILCNKGVMDVASISWWYDLRNMSEEYFVALEVCCILSASICPIAVRQIYDPLRKYAGYQVRDIVHCKAHTDLRILPCIIRPDNVSAVINLLEISSPTPENPTSVYVLHLIKMMGLSQPVFISHDMQKKKDNKMRSYSDDVVWAFKRFERNYNPAAPAALSIHPYTAVSPADAMHEDICTLALDKMVSLIVLPFHRRYGFEGCIEYDDHDLRILNCGVLARSPCSVAILIDRSHSSSAAASAPTRPTLSSSSIDQFRHYKLGVIFIGGRDDREALAYAKRMRSSTNNRMTRLDVIRIVAQNNTNNQLNQQDSFAIKEFQDSVKDLMFNHSSSVSSAYSQNQQQPTTVVNYVQVPVMDGSDTALRLREIAMEYDLLLVGRRYNVNSPEVEGLGQWAEVEELGVVGDLLAAPDLRCRASVLVVQRQRQWIRKHGKTI